MILELLILIFMLGANTHDERSAACHKIMISEYSYAECRKIYEHKDIKIDPEIRLTLRDILYFKYTKEYGEIHYDEDSLKAAFERDMRFGNEKVSVQ